jgi:hypothetical protein
MTEQAFTHDFTMMYVMHDALRRELGRIADIVATADNPRKVLRESPGWAMFKQALHVHHHAEDEALWPAVRAAAAGNAADLAVLDAMEEQHAAVGPGLRFLDAALDDGEAGAARLPVIVERLVAGLGGHLTDEEEQALAVLDTYATPELLVRFGTEHSSRIGADAPRFVPWMLEGAKPEYAEAVLGRLPEPVRQAYAQHWAPAYAETELWLRG